MPLSHIFDPYRATVNYLFTYKLSVTGGREILGDMVGVRSPRRFRVGRKAGDFSWITSYCESKTLAILFDDAPVLNDHLPDGRTEIEPRRLGRDTDHRHREKSHDGYDGNIIYGDASSPDAPYEIWRDKHYQLEKMCMLNDVGLLYGHVIGPITDWEPIHAYVPFGLTQGLARDMAAMLELTGFIWIANRSSCDLETPDCKMIMTRPLRDAA